MTRSHAHTHGTVGSIETQNGPPRGPLTPFPGPSRLARPGNRRSDLCRLHRLRLFSNFRCVESSGAASASAFAQPPRRLRDSATALCAPLRLRGVFHHKGASHPSARGHWACFCSFPITNVAAMDGRALVLRWAHGALFSSVSPAGGIPGARGRHVGPTTGVQVTVYPPVLWGERDPWFVALANNSTMADFKLPT